MIYKRLKAEHDYYKLWKLQQNTQAEKELLQAEIKRLRSSKYVHWEASPGQAYATALLSVLFLLAPEPECDKKVLLSEIDFLMETLRIDLFGQSVTDVLLATPEDYSHAHNFFHGFPLAPDLNQLRTLPHAEIPFEGNTVLSCPYRLNKWHKAMRDLISNQFQFDKRSGSGMYIPELKVLLLYADGRHHSAAAKLMHTGSAYVPVFSLASHFPYIDIADGCWIDREHDQSAEITDARFALLFTLAKRKWEIETQPPI